MKKRPAKAVKISGDKASEMLRDAAKRKEFAAMHEVLNSVSSLPIKNKHAQEAFMRSAFSEDLSLVRRFLNLGFHINDEFNGHRLLVHAAACPNEEFFNSLLGLGADINLTGWNGMTPLIMAASTATQVSDPGGLLKRVKDLVKLGADIDATDHYGRTALDYGFRAESVEVVRLLFKLGAALTACSSGGHECLMHATNAVGDELLKLVLKAGADPTWPVCGEGKTLLEYLAEKGSESKVKLLIKAGLPKRLPDGRDAMSVAREGAKQIDSLFNLLDRAQALQHRLAEIASRFPGMKSGNMYLGETGYFLGRQECFCPNNDSLLVRIGKQAVKAALKNPGAEPFEYKNSGRTRLMEEWVNLSPPLIQDDQQLEDWLIQAVNYVKGLKKK